MQGSRSKRAPQAQNHRSPNKAKCIRGQTPLFRRLCTSNRPYSGHTHFGPWSLCPGMTVESTSFSPPTFLGMHLSSLCPHPWPQCSVGNMPIKSGLPLLPFLLSVSVGATIFQQILTTPHVGQTQHSAWTKPTKAAVPMKLTSQWEDTYINI